MHGHLAPSPVSPATVGPAARMVRAMPVAPDGARRAAYREFQAALVAAGVWSRLLGLWVLAAHDEGAAYVNLRYPGRNAITNNGCAFAADTGISGDGEAAYLDLGIPGSALPRDSCHIGGWITGGTDAGGAAALLGHNPGMTFFINPRNGNDRFTARLSSLSNSTFGDSNTIIGHFVAVRSGAEATAGYVDGELLGTGTEASAEAGDGNIRALAHTSPAQFADFTVAMLHCGYALDAGQVAALNTAAAALLTEIGAIGA